MNMDKYMNTYLDRRMRVIIDEWQLTTRYDVADFSRRLHSLEKEIAPIKDFEFNASEKLTVLEKRLKTLQEGMQ